MTIIVHLYGDFAVKILVGILHGKVKNFDLSISIMAVLHTYLDFYKTSGECVN